MRLTKKKAIELSIKKYGIYNLGCRQEDHPFTNWVEHETKENAQKVLGLIKAIKIEE